MKLLVRLTFIAISCSYLNRVDSADDTPPRIISKTIVDSRDSFTVYCNRSSWRGVKLPDGARHFEWLAVNRELTPGSVLPVAFYFSNTTHGYVHSYDNATAMGWTFSYAGIEGTNNIDRIQLNMTFNVAGCSDAGAYMCWAHIPSRGASQYTAKSYLLPRPPTHPGDTRGCPGKGVLSPIISKNVIGPNDNFTVTCDISKFYQFHFPNYNVLRIGIYKLDIFEKKRILMSYYPVNVGTFLRAPRIVPAGRKWDFMNSGEGANTSVKLTVNFAQFEDAGTYLCEVALNTTSRLRPPVTTYSIPAYLHALDVHYGPLLINKYDVGPNDQFRMTCDVTKFKDRNVPRDKDITYLGLAYEMDDKAKLPLAEYKSPGGIFKTRFVPKDRNWKFSYSGGNTTQGNRNLIRLTMDVLDARCEDAGAYYCIIIFAGQTGYIMSTEQYLQPRAPRHELDFNGCIFPSNTTLKPSPIINKRVIGEKDNFEMKCDASSFRNRVLPPTLAYEQIGMVRRLPSDHVDKLLGIYWPTAPASDPVMSLIPPGRQWTFRYANGPVNTNKDAIKLIMTVRDAGCRDAGIYKCVVKIASLNRYFYSLPYVLYPRGPLYLNEPNTCPYSQWTLIPDLMINQDNLTWF